MTPTVETLRGALRDHDAVEHAALPGRTNHRRAGVLVPLRWSEGRIEVLTTLRPATLRRHGGEVSLPGGRPEPEDDSLLDTALREAREELGLEGVDVLGRLASMPVYTSEFRLEPFVGRIDPAAALRPDPGEVAAVLPLDLTAILASGRIEGVSPRDGAWLMPVFRPGGHLLFGATALTIVELLGVLAAARGQAAPEVTRGTLAWDDVLTLKAAAARTAPPPPGVPG